MRFPSAPESGFFRVRWLLRVWMVAAVAGAMLGLAGCHSPYVAATIHNGTGAAVTVVELDYPSASFGTDALAAGADFHYRFKIRDSGPLKVIWTDAARQNHTAMGPLLAEGQEGRLTVTLGPKTAQWDVDVRPVK